MVLIDIGQALRAKLYLKKLRSIFHEAVVFCLSDDMQYSDLVSMDAQKRWYIYQHAYDYQTNTFENLMDEWGDTFVERTRIAPIKVDNGIDYDNYLLQIDYNEMVERIRQYIKKYNDVVLETSKIYKVSSLVGVLYVELFHLILSNRYVKKCPYCKRYFVPSSRIVEYCSRMIPGKNKTCREYAPLFFFRDKQKNGDEYRLVLSKAIQAHNMRNHRNPNLYTKDHLNAWRKAADILYEIALKEGMPLDVFKDKLKPNHISV